MSRILSLCLALLASFCLVTAAQAEEISNEFFVLNVPSGWQKTISPTQANGALVVLVQNPKEKIVVSVSITPVKMPAKQLAEVTAKNMQAGGFTKMRRKAQSFRAGI